MQTKQLEIPCPTCGSRDVFYSCTPNCCFNHVCENCRTTFEPVTVATGAWASDIIAPDPLPECTQPAVACVKCDSTAVYMAEATDSLVCSKCGALLTLELTEVTPDKS